MELPELAPRHICADYLEGLIHVVPKYGAGDDAGRYCIGGFTIDLYSGLLQEQQQQYPQLCRRAVFLLRYDKVSGVFEIGVGFFFPRPTLFTCAPQPIADDHRGRLCEEILSPVLYGEEFNENCTPRFAT